MLEAVKRARVGFASTKLDVDPIGACVGRSGTRIQVISRELRGKKIDIIEWSHDPATFVARALSPAKVSSVTIHEADSEGQPSAIVIVPDNQLSLAIGKKGQNARLAAKLTGMRIDIKSESEVEAERSPADTAVAGRRTATARLRAEPERAAALVAARIRMCAQARWVRIHPSWAWGAARVSAPPPSAPSPRYAAGGSRPPSGDPANLARTWRRRCGPQQGRGPGPPRARRAYDQRGEPRAVA